MRTLPAGLLPGDHRVEFFNDHANTEIAYGVTDGLTRRVNDLGDQLKAAIDGLISSFPKKDKALEAIGYFTPDSKREKIISCLYGPLDGNPDFENGAFQSFEFWMCPQRLTCKVSGTLCEPLRIGEGKALSARETQILILTAQGKLNKEIADTLGISTHTVNNQVTTIQRKTGLQNKKELVALAHQKLLL